MSVAGGPVLPRSRWLAERVSALLLNSHLGSTPSGHVSRRERPRFVKELTGANLLIRDDVFRDVGGFQSPSVGGEAVRLCYKVRSLLGLRHLLRAGARSGCNGTSFPGSVPG